MHRVGLEVLGSNTVASGLYTKLGFTETGRQAGVYEREGQLVDNIVMELSLDDLPAA